MRAALKIELCGEDRAADRKLLKLIAALVHSENNARC